MIKIGSANRPFSPPLILSLSKDLADAGEARELVQHASILIAVTAAPWSDDKSTRLS